MNLIITTKIAVYVSIVPFGLANIYLINPKPLPLKYVEPSFLVNAKLTNKIVRNTPNNTGHIFNLDLFIFFLMKIKDFWKKTDTIPQIQPRIINI